jgi:hypothetical protein
VNLAKLTTLCRFDDIQRKSNWDLVRQYRNVEEWMARTAQPVKH